MENDKHKGSELNNVKETWDQNERNLENRNTAVPEPDITAESAPRNSLDELIRQEATEYDNTNKETRVLDGDRASVKDDQGNTSDE